MNTLYPDNVIQKILEITLESQPFGFLSIEPNGTLISKGGKFSPQQLAELVVNQPCLDNFPYIESFCQDATAIDFIPALDLGEDTLVDLHLFRDDELIWAIFLDKTEEWEWQKKAKQKGNELRLLQQRLKEQHEVNEAPRSGYNRKSLEIDVFQTLNTLALVKNPDDSFSLLHHAPKSFETLFPECFEEEYDIYPQNKFVFLENFLVDAKSFWQSNQNLGRLNSGPWIETVESEQAQEEYALEATATIWDGHKILFLKLIAEEYQNHKNVLQIGREEVLERHHLEKEVHKRTKTIRDREEEIALRLVCAADSRDDGETGSHIRRLGLYSELMAKKLGWPQDKVDEIRIAAPMHDIGKIGIPDRILRKPGKLTEEEYEIMKRHPLIGSQILSDSHSPLVNMAEEICLGHHERWDGTGYPFGLSGEQIPISARIVALVDVFDALIHKRVYKDEIELSEAINIMQKGRGSHFDPELFDLFVTLKDQMKKISEDYQDPPIRPFDQSIF